MVRTERFSSVAGGMIEDIGQPKTLIPENFSPSAFVWLPKTINTFNRAGVAYIFNNHQKKLKIRCLPCSWISKFFKRSNKYMKILKIYYLFSPISVQEL